MKKHLYRALAVISASVIMTSVFLTGCNTDSNNSNNKATVTNNGYTTEGKETKLVPDENLKGSLTVSYYMPDYGIPGDQLIAATKKFKELYPNCELIIDRCSKDVEFQAYGEKLSAEIMGGKGPDVFWVASGDINKMMRTGVIADMYDYFENDKNFNIDDYYKNVLCGGQPSGTQYIVPTTFNFPIIISTEKMIKESGLDISKFTDYLSSFEEIDKLAQKYKDNKTTKAFFGTPTVAFSIPDFTGLDWMNYDDKTVNLDFPEIKRGFELVKNSFSQEYIDQLYGSGVATGKAFKNSEAVISECTFTPFMEVYWALRQIEKVGETPVIFPWRNATGKISANSADSIAVRYNSQNKQAAYNFMKILINPEIQANEMYYSSSVPVSRVSVKKALEQNKDALTLGTMDGAVELEAVSENVQKLFDQYLKLLEDVEMDYLAYGSWELTKAMMPYVKGEKSYEECIKVAQESLEIYVSE